MARLKTATRKISNRGKSSPIGTSPSRKNGQPVPWESQAERDAHTEAEYDKRVLRYTPQPVTLPVWVSGVKRSYTPDLEVQLQTGEVIYREVKSCREDLDDAAATKLAAVDRDLRARRSRLELTFRR